MDADRRANPLRPCDSGGENWAPDDKESKRERFLSPEETERLGEVLAEAESEMPSAVAAFRLLLLTGCRLSEIQFLRWEYVRDDCIELPDAKTGGRIVPLGPEARAVLAALPREEDNPWVILGRLPGSHITDLQRPWRRIRARVGLEDVRIHDLRHSYGTKPDVIFQQSLLVSCFQYILNTVIRPTDLSQLRAVIA